MEPVFDAYVMVDWSGASEPRTGADSIWVASCERQPSGVLTENAAVNPATREAAVTLLLDMLTDYLARDRRVLLGFDFAFGFPQGFAAKLGGAASWLEVWKALAALVKDGADNKNTRFAAAERLNSMISGMAAPFWGHPWGHAYKMLAPRKPVAGLPEFRLAEQRAKAKSVWQLYGAGAVGSQTLLGIPRAFTLRHHPWLRDKTKVWPFETKLAPLARPGEGGWRIMMAEIYPAILPQTAQGAVKDETQMRSACRHFAMLDAAHRLSPHFAGDPALPPEQRRLAETEEGWILGLGPQAHDVLRDPAAIYRDSFAQIRAEADLSQVPADLDALAIRVVHACGMVDVAAALVASPGAGEAGRQALLAGKPILVDAEMVSHGIIRRKLPAANQVLCTLNDEAVPALAKSLATTRSAAAVEKWREHLDGAIVVIGNAPTALFHLMEMVRAGAPRPALVLGFPVGFVGAAESKEALIASGLPFVTLPGRRGGSAMAAAALNALAGGNEE